MANPRPKVTDYFHSPKGHIRDRIIIHESADMPKEGFPFALNGFAFLAKPGEEIDIPRPVRKMLDTRVKTETVYTDDGQHHSRNIPRVTYTLVAEDIDALPPEGGLVPEEEVTVPLAGQAG